VREELAAAFHIPQEKRARLDADTGSGYGGKHTGETAIRSRPSRSRRQKARQSRLDTQRRIYLGLLPPSRRHRHSRFMDSNGHLELWESTNFNSGGSGLNTPYAVEVRNEHFQPTKYPLRQGSYRGLAATANHFRARIVRHG